jgi:hypothetical protein
MAVWVQLVGLLFLLGGMWLGYQQWIHPHAATVTPAGRGLLMLVVVTLMGGLIGSPFWWTDQIWSFSWDLPPLASRMLASAGFAFASLCFLVLRRPSYRRLRLIVILLFVYLAPLAIAILVFHLDRFNFQAPITYAFFAIVLPMILVASWFLFRQPRIIPDQESDTYPANPVIQVWLMIVAFITGVWGLALIATDSGPSGLIWVWPGDLLSSRLIAVMLLTIAVGALYSFRYSDTARPMLVMILVYSLGLSVASLWNILYDLPIKPLYTAVFSVILVVTTVLYMSDKEPSRVLIYKTLKSRS